MKGSITRSFIHPWKIHIYERASVRREFLRYSSYQCNRTRVRSSACADSNVLLFSQSFQTPSLAFPTALLVTTWPRCRASRIAKGRIFSRAAYTSLRAPSTF